WSVTPNVWGLLIGPPGMHYEEPSAERRTAAHKDARCRGPRGVQAGKSRVRHKVGRGQGKDRKRKEATAKILAKDKGAAIADLLKPHNPDGEEPTLKRYITTNATYEALAELIQQNPNGLLVDRDEMLALLDRLDEDGHADERGFYLSG